MKIPRDLSGEGLVKALCRNWGYRVVHQEGSHIVLETADPSHQRIVVPAHRQLRVGTLSAILRSIARHKGVPRESILRSLA
ncbi:MAG TPA: type II toxin-antitoxin system HicA family toxin [Terriglobia bacterium]|nr:type II toxin-antitoxin system HicA family toxin [Terriglobia bacterium]